MKPSPWKSSTTARRIISPRNISAALALAAAIRCAIERQYEWNALIEEKDNYYGIFDHLVEGIFRTTPDGHYLLANVALAHIYGYRLADGIDGEHQGHRETALRGTGPARGIRPVDAGRTTR